jgi:hypothetical protein
MASTAFTTFLRPLLDDALEIDRAHQSLRTGNAGRQWGLGSLNRAAIVMTLSAWEAYVEELAVEAVDSFMPTAPSQTIWQSIKADTLSRTKRFNTPNAQNVRELFRTCIGLGDVTAGWGWQNTPSTKAVNRLTTAITLRHQIAHGVNPRPTVHNQYAARLPRFFQLLGVATDNTVRAHLVNALHVPNPWPL